MSTYDVFILTSEWRDEGGLHEIRLYGKSEALGPVELIFDQVKPIFFVDQLEKLPALDCQFERKSLPLTTMKGRAVDGLYFRNQQDLKTAADRFKATGVRHFEADVRPDDRFLMERFLKDQAIVSGEYLKQGGLCSFRNPKIKAGGSRAKLVLASLDIETGVASGQLYSIGVHLTGAPQEEKVVFMLGDQRQDLPENLMIFPSETALLEAFLAWFKRVDPDLIIGWHVIGFDLMFLEKKCRELGLVLDLARNGRPISLVEKPGSGFFATIPGRVVLDGLPVLRGALYRFPNYKLETVAQHLLHSGKLIASDQDKIGEIERQFREDKPALARYNLEDCVLVTRIFEKTQMISLLKARSQGSGMLMGSLALGNAALDHFYLPKLHRLGMVAPNASTSPAEQSGEGPDNPLCVPGVYENVAVFQWCHALPMLIRIFNLDPLAKAKAEVDPLMAPGGLAFSKQFHLLPELFQSLMKPWFAANREEEKTTVRALDIQMASFLNVLSSKTCRFFDPQLITALKHAEAWLVEGTRSYLDEMGFKLICGSAQNLFVVMNNVNRADFTGAAARLAESLSDRWAERLEREFGKGRFALELQSCFPKLVMLEPKTAYPLKPRYAAMGVEAKEPLSSEELDTVIANWTPMARSFQDQMYRRYLTGETIEPWITDFVKQLKAGAFDGDLSFTKRIKKPLSEYGKQAPAHVKAARLLKTQSPIRRISYVYAKDGPTPVELKPSQLDYDHYIQRQIEPIANVLLQLLGKSFAKLSQPEQISLF